MEFNGITTFGNPRNARVIYVKVKMNEELLDPIMEVISSAFDKFIDKKEKQRDVTFHLTIFNTNKLKDGSHFTIDASDIIKKYQGKSFGIYKADSIDFAQMINRWVDTKYKLLNSIPLP